MATKKRRKVALSYLALRGTYLGVAKDGQHGARYRVYLDRPASRRELLQLLPVQAFLESYSPHWFVVRLPHGNFATTENHPRWVHPTGLNVVQKKGSEENRDYGHDQDWPTAWMDDKWTFDAGQDTA